MKDFDELKFTDDYMFCKTLVLNPELCKELAEMIIGRKIEKIISVRDQKPVKALADGKGVRFDVCLEGEDEICDIEMQNDIDKTVLPKRCRYYQSAMDVECLMQGEDYTKLKKSYIIFLCGKKPFEGEDRHIFTFKNICVEKTSLALGDETVKIFLTPEGTADDISGEMEEFMAYMTDNTVKTDFAQRLDDAIQAIKNGEGWRIEYMQLKEKMENQFEAGKEEGRKEGREEGVMSKAIETAKNLLKLNKNTYEEIAECTGLTIEEIKKLEEDMRI